MNCGRISDPSPPGRKTDQLKMLASFSNWVERAHFYLDKEQSDALVENRQPDYYAALISAFQSTRIWTDEDEIRSIKFCPKEDFKNASFFQNFWSKAMKKPTTSTFAFFSEMQDRRICGDKVIDADLAEKGNSKVVKL